MRRLRKSIALSLMVGLASQDILPPGGPAFPGRLRAASSPFTAMALMPPDLLFPIIPHALAGKGNRVPAIKLNGPARANVGLPGLMFVQSSGRDNAPPGPPPNPRWDLSGFTRKPDVLGSREELALGRDQKMGPPVPSDLQSWVIEWLLPAFDAVAKGNFLDLEPVREAATHLPKRFNAPDVIAPLETWREESSRASTRDLGVVFITMLNTVNDLFLAKHHLFIYPTLPRGSAVAMTSHLALGQIRRQRRFTLLGKEVPLFFIWPVWTPDAPFVGTYGGGRIIILLDRILLNTLSEWRQNPAGTTLIKHPGTGEEEQTKDDAEAAPDVVSFDSPRDPVPPFALLKETRRQRYADPSAFWPVECQKVIIEEITHAALHLLVTQGSGENRTFDNAYAEALLQHQLSLEAGLRRVLEFWEHNAIENDLPAIRQNAAITFTEVSGNIAKAVFGPDISENLLHWLATIREHHLPDGSYSDLQYHDVAMSFLCILATADYLRISDAYRHPDQWKSVSGKDLIRLSLAISNRTTPDIRLAQWTFLEKEFPEYARVLSQSPFPELLPNGTLRLRDRLLYRTPPMTLAEGSPAIPRLSADITSDMRALLETHFASNAAAINRLQTIMAASGVHFQASSDEGHKIVMQFHFSKDGDLTGIDQAVIHTDPSIPKSRLISRLLVELMGVDLLSEHIRCRMTCPETLGVLTEVFYLNLAAYFSVYTNADEFRLSPDEKMRVGVDTLMAALRIVIRPFDDPVRAAMTKTITENYFLFEFKTLFQSFQRLFDKTTLRAKYRRMLDAHIRNPFNTVAELSPEDLRDVRGWLGEWNREFNARMKPLIAALRKSGRLDGSSFLAILGGIGAGAQAHLGIPGTLALLSSALLAIVVWFISGIPETHPGGISPHERSLPASDA